MQDVGHKSQNKEVCRLYAELSPVMYVVQKHADDIRDDIWTTHVDTSSRSTLERFHTSRVIRMSSAAKFHTKQKFPLKEQTALLKVKGNFVSI